MVDEVSTFLTECDTHIRLVIAAYGTFQGVFQRLVLFESLVDVVVSPI
jgi:hypothetical protein